MATQNLHRQKRPFQPSITSYFDRVDRDEYDRSRTPAARQPVLEPSVQSNLLSVGMRIRKAVPEGYKTHKTSLFFDPTPALPSTSTYSPAQPRRPAELVPFCGLHKVGGHGIQDMPRPVDAHEPVDIFADDRMPFDLSQESTSSTLSTDSMPAAPMLNPITTNKRHHSDDEDDDGDIPPFELHFPDPLNPTLADLSVSPTTTVSPISHTTYTGSGAVSRRAIAKPKSRRKAMSVAAATADCDMDFEDADFLRPWEEDELMMTGL
ncbi:uncharacterized protein PV09_04057 [Verruconis gallopava]|uniref:Uncharacterized protein n=1 Tax=Verruconis gallopava TaxID=253628 RepID=A0A0D1YW11_9PEZI|nr:uncharacterized protein PV09_04057 [Verruconis gallopava]KIW04882.1 hypothetical protein PV09_04057 [Verruconis gallopava]